MPGKRQGRPRTDRERTALRAVPLLRRHQRSSGHSITPFPAERLDRPKRFFRSLREKDDQGNESSRRPCCRSSSTSDCRTGDPHTSISGSSRRAANRTGLSLETEDSQTEAGQDRQLPGSGQRPARTPLTHRRSTRRQRDPDWQGVEHRRQINQNRRRGVCFGGHRRGKSTSVPRAPSAESRLMTCSHLSSARQPHR